MRNRIWNEWFAIATAVTIAVIIIGCVSFFAYLGYGNNQTYEGEITSMYNKRDGESDRFFIVLDNDRVLLNEDILLKWKFDSADVQARFKEGQDVQVETIGRRSQFWSSYPRVVEIEQLQEEE